MVITSVPAVPDLDHHSATAAANAVVSVDSVAAVVPALGHGLGLGRLDGLHSAVPGHLFLGEVLYRVGDAWTVRVVRLGRDPHRFGVIILAATTRHAPVGHLAASVSDGRRRRVTAARIRPVHFDGRIPSAGGGRVLLVAERLVQLGRVVQQAFHEDLLLRIVPPVRSASAAAAAIAQLSRAGPAAGQRSVPVVGAHRQVLGAPAQHAHDVRAL